MKASYQKTRYEAYLPENRNSSIKIPGKSDLADACPGKQQEERLFSSQKRNSLHGCVRFQGRSPTLTSDPALDHLGTFTKSSTETLD